MSSVNNIYLLIFLPLITALFCQAFQIKNTPFWFALLGSAASFCLLVKIFPTVLLSEKVFNDYELSLTSIALEFRLDLLGVIFLFLLIFLKIVTLLLFYKEIKSTVNQKIQHQFYSLFLVHLFAIIGIITANNLLNLFLFFEIYFFAFFAFSSISNNRKLLKDYFLHFSINSASSLVILFCFLILYATFNELGFDRIVQNFAFLPAKKSWFVGSIFTLLTTAFLFKFFPLWLNFRKIKNSDTTSNLLLVDSIFIQTLLGIFLIIKFTYFFFGSKFLFENFAFDKILLLVAFALTAYSAFKLFTQKNLKIICAYLCINHLGFIIGAIALKSAESMQAMFFFLVNFCLTNFFIFIVANLLRKYFAGSSIEKINHIKGHYFLLIFPLKLSLIFIASFPLTFLFFANWHFAYAVFNYGLELILIAAMLLSILAQITVAIKIFDVAFGKNLNQVSTNNFLKRTSEISLFEKTHFIIFWLIIATIYVINFTSGFANDLALKFASFLLSNS